MSNLIRIPEPKLLFRYNQGLEDPRDGLTLFGPLDEAEMFGVRYGVIGTEEGIKRFSNWVGKINDPIYDEGSVHARPPFFGFETIFKIPWRYQPAICLEVPMGLIEKNVNLDEKHQRVYNTVELFTSEIVKAINQEDIAVDIWFVVIPDVIYKNCRPLSTVEKDLRVPVKTKLSVKQARKLQWQMSFFPEDEEASKAYAFEVNFHNQLKARLLQHRVLTQIVRESTIAPKDFLDHLGRAARDMDKYQASVAWSISTSVYYKIGGRPWKMSGIRKGVCYLGLVFKQTPNSEDVRSACCAAQMFLDSGDGIVFRGDVGPWFIPDEGNYHLEEKAAKELVDIAVKTYRDKMGEPPSELFIHGRVSFNDDEWNGFRSAIDEKTNIVGVQIRDSSNLKLFHQNKFSIMRGLAYVYSKKTAYLWTRGFIPRLRTYPGREVPNPLQIRISRGKGDLRVILNDVLALTKLNYNACLYGDGLPVTLKFADAVGEILTAGPLPPDIPLPFKHYI